MKRFGDLVKRGNAGLGSGLGSQEAKAPAKPAAPQEKAEKAAPQAPPAQIIHMEIHPFQSMTLTDQQFLTGCNEAKTVTIAGALRLPHPENDRLPVVVLLHGSGGVSSFVLDWEKDLNVMGGGNLATVWEKEAERRNIVTIRIAAEEWRHVFLYSREQRCGTDSKRHAGELARKVIDWAQASRPTALRHDTAEAIMIGLWGLLHLGWLQALPKELQR